MKSQLLVSSIVTCCAVQALASEATSPEAAAPAPVTSTVTATVETVEIPVVEAALPHQLAYGLETVRSDKTSKDAKIANKGGLYVTYHYSPKNNFNFRAGLDVAVAHDGAAGPNENMTATEANGEFVLQGGYNFTFVGNHPEVSLTPLVGVRSFAMNDKFASKDNDQESNLKTSMAHFTVGGAVGVKATSALSLGLGVEYVTAGEGRIESETSFAKRTASVDIEGKSGSLRLEPSAAYKFSPKMGVNLAYAVASRKVEAKGKVKTGDELDMSTQKFQLGLYHTL